MLIFSLFARIISKIFSNSALSIISSSDNFSISFATAYAALLEKKVKWLTVDQGVPFGLAVWIAFHLVIMPLMKTVPSPKDQPLEEHISEALGHIAWMWTNNEIAEIVLKQLGQRKKER